MTISNRMLLALMALVAGAVGLSMYVGLRMGLDASAAQAAPQVLTMSPTAAAAPAVPEPTAAAVAPATLTTDQCAFLMAVDDANADGTDEQDATGAWYDTGAEVSVEQGDFATNSGVIDGSQFNDGGFGDIGQQWWGVTVNGNVTNVNVDQGGTANVNVGADQAAPAPTPPAPAPDPQPVAAPTPSQPVAAPTPAAPVGSSGDATAGAASAGAASAEPVLTDAVT